MLCAGRVNDLTARITAPDAVVLCPLVMTAIHLGGHMDALTHLAEFITAVSSGDLPEHVRAWCGTLTADSVGCTLGALAVPEGRAMARSLWQQSSIADRAGGSGSPEARPYRVCVSGDLLGGVHIDASLANLLDFDDVYEGSGHITWAVVPIAFRLGISLRTRGADVLGAIAAGLEVGCRFAEATRPSDHARQLVWGIGTRLALATAATAARLLGLPVESSAHALALALATAPVPSVRKTVYGGSGVTWVKNNAGAAAAAGVAAALMAREGALGPLDILDGPQGFARMIGTDTWKPDVLTGQLGHAWMIPRIGLKPYPCCRHAHAVIDAALACAARLQVDPEAIDEISVAGPVWIHHEPFNNAAPGTMHAAQYSLGYVVAVALLGIEPGLAWFDPATLASVAVRALALKVHAEPQPSAVGRVRIRAGSRRASAEIQAPKGSPDAPMSEQEVAAKFRRLVAPTLDDAVTDRLYQMCLALDREQDAHALGELLPAVDVRKVPAGARGD